MSQQDNNKELTSIIESLTSKVLQEDILSSRTIRSKIEDLQVELSDVFT